MFAAGGPSSRSAKPLFRAPAKPAPGAGGAFLFYGPAAGPCLQGRRGATRRLEVEGGSVRSVRSLFPLPRPPGIGPGARPMLAARGRRVRFAAADGWRPRAWRAANKRIGNILKKGQRGRARARSLLNSRSIPGACFFEAGRASRCWAAFERVGTRRARATCLAIMPTTTPECCGR